MEGADGLCPSEACPGCAQMDALNLQLGVPRVDSFVRKDFEAWKAQKAAEGGGPARTCAPALSAYSTVDNAGHPRCAGFTWKSKTRFACTLVHTSLRQSYRDTGIHGS